MSDKTKLRTSLADEVYEQLKSDMADFVLVPGDRFSENEICERLEVSRTPVRQALVRLQQEGLVEVLFRNGWRVLPFDFQRFDQLYDLRLLIETEAIERLCEGRITGDAQASQATIEQLAAIWLVPKSRRLQEGSRVSELDEQFHCALVAACGNTEMLRVHRDITERIRVIRKLDFTQRPRVEATYEEHAKILQAILSRRTEQSRLLLKAHVEASQLEVRKITLHQLQLARK
jgi:DNA-binding GntR family transcriptional regulator